VRNRITASWETPRPVASTHLFITEDLRTFVTERNISEECSASIAGVKTIGELGTTLAVISMS
jgi:hypothetical protein